MTEKIRISIEIRDFRGVLKSHFIEELEEGDELVIFYPKQDRADIEFEGRKRHG